MTKHPFAVPARLSPNLVRARAYWQSLLRGGAKIPFWDDLNPASLGDLRQRSVLIDVFERPERFRLNACGDSLEASVLAGRFIDEVDLPWPFQFLRSQCSATVEAAAATFFEWRDGDNAARGRPYRRLLLPMWGEGRVGLLLGVVDFD